MSTSPPSNMSNMPPLPPQARAGDALINSSDAPQYPYYPRNPLPPRAQQQTPTPPQRMPKDQALMLLLRLKRWSVAVSLAGFATLAGLAASHAVGVTNTTSASPAQATPSQQNNDDGGNFFQQQPGGFGIGSGGSGQSPVSGSSSS